MYTCIETYVLSWKIYCSENFSVGPVFVLTQSNFLKKVVNGTKMMFQLVFFAFLSIIKVIVPIGTSTGSYNLNWVYIMIQVCTRSASVKSYSNGGVRVRR